MLSSIAEGWLPPDADGSDSICFHTISNYNLNPNYNQFHIPQIHRLYTRSIYSIVSSCLLNGKRLLVFPV
jgi:hypothetical protein